MRIIFLFMLCLMGCMACTSNRTLPLKYPTATPDTSLFAQVPCWNTVPEEFEIRCGFVTVPQNRARPLSAENQVRLAVAIIKIPGEDPQPDPILLLTGGPGNAAIAPLTKILSDLETLPGRTNEIISPEPEYVLEQYQLAYSTFKDIVRQHEFILLDQRGTGYSEPSLDCGTKGPKDCYQHLTQSGIDLAAFNTVENAKDVDAVRIALGYQQINLLGGSYGSRLGLAVMRHFSENVRSAVLDSVSPPHINYQIRIVQEYEDSLRVLFTRCASDPDCVSAYPHLQEDFFAVVDRLNRSSAILQVTGNTISFSGDQFNDLVWNSLYEPLSTAYLPLLIHETNQGNLEVLENFLEAAVGAAAKDPGSEGMMYSCLCSEETPFQSEQAVQEASRKLNPIIRTSVIERFTGIFHVCENWPVPPQSSSEKTLVISDVPTLLLSGEFDPATPPAFAHEVAQGLTNVNDLTFPRLGHGSVFTNGCKMNIIAQFLNEPNDELNTQCIQEIRPLKFALP